MTGERDDGARDFLAQAKDAEARGYWEKGAEIMTAALQTYPRDAEFHALLGWFTFKNDFSDKEERERLGIHHLEFALDLDRNNPVPHLYLGKIYRALGNNNRAELLFKNALAAHPNFQPAVAALQDLAEEPRRRVPTAQPYTSGARKRTRPILLAAAALAVAGVYLLMSLQDEGRKRRKEIASIIETTLPIEDGFKTGEGSVSFVVDRGAWEALTGGARQNELEAIRLRIAGRGIREVLVLAGNSPVALITPEKVCLGPDCVAWPSR